MNVKRFTARTAREALALVREAFGDDAVVLSTKPSADGVEVLAMAPEGLARIEQAAAQAPAPRPAAPPPAAAAAAAPRPMTLAERIAARGERLEPRPEPRRGERIEPGLFTDGTAPAEPSADSSVARDVETLGMSTLTFQDYVRERMLKRRQAELAQPPATLQQRLACATNCNRCAADRGALRRPGLHGAAAAPAAPGQLSQQLLDAASRRP
jgi:flagellar biosynthesis protein FlhF